MEGSESLWAKCNQKQIQDRGFESLRNEFESLHLWNRKSTQEKGFESFKRISEDFGKKAKGFDSLTKGFKSLKKNMKQKVEKRK